jgi:hypothetical protein
MLPDSRRRAIAMRAGSVVLGASAAARSRRDQGIGQNKTGLRLGAENSQEQEADQEWKDATKHSSRTSNGAGKNLRKDKSKSRAVGRNLIPRIANLFFLVAAGVLATGLNLTRAGESGRVAVRDCGPLFPGSTHSANLGSRALAQDSAKTLLAKLEAVAQNVDCRFRKRGLSL